MVELIPGGVYVVKARYYSVGIWTGECFIGPRLEYGSWKMEQEYLWDNGVPFGTATPVERIGDTLLSSPYGGGGEFLKLLRAFNDYYDMVNKLEEETNIDGNSDSNEEGSGQESSTEEG